MTCNYALPLCNSGASTLPPTTSSSASAMPSAIATNTLVGLDAYGPDSQTRRPRSRSPRCDDCDGVPVNSLHTSPAEVYVEFVFRCRSCWQNASADDKAAAEKEVEVKIPASVPRRFRQRYARLVRQGDFFTQTNETIEQLMMLSKDVDYVIRDVFDELDHARGSHKHKHGHAHKHHGHGHGHGHGHNHGHKHHGHSHKHHGHSQTHSKEREKTSGGGSSDEPTYVSAVTDKSERLLTKYLEASAMAMAVAAAGKPKDGGAHIL